MSVYYKYKIKSSRSKPDWLVNPMLFFIVGWEKTPQMVKGALVAIAILVLAVLFFAFIAPDDPPVTL